MLVYPAQHHTQAPGCAVPARRQQGRGKGRMGAVPAARWAPRLPGTGSSQAQKSLALQVMGEFVQRARREAATSRDTEAAAQGCLSNLLVALMADAP